MEILFETSFIFLYTHEFWKTLHKISLASLSSFTTILIRSSQFPVGSQFSAEFFTILYFEKLFVSHIRNFCAFEKLFVEFLWPS